MSWCDRRTFLILPLALSACGFAPTLAPGGAAAGLQGKIRLADPVDKNGFDFLGRMEERLGRADVPEFDLAYAIQTRAEGVGITTEGAIQRFNLVGSVDWTLTRHGGTVRVGGGRVESFTSYSATGSTVAEQAAEEDAALRLMRILADRIVAELLAQAANWS